MLLKDFLNRYDNTCLCTLIWRFSKDRYIVDKYLNYRSLGQKGWDLDRLIDEETLTVEKLPEKIIPNWFKINNEQNPINKKKLIELYSGEIS